MTDTAIVVLLIRVADNGEADVELHQGGTVPPELLAQLLHRAAAQLAPPPRIVLPENGALN